MMQSTPRRDALVVLKGRPAVVRHVSKTVEVETGDGQRLQVRPKDVTLLHPGPLETAAGLPPLAPGQAGELEVAWELLAGTVTNLAELAELAFGAYTPASAWAAWLALSDGLLFRGTPQELVARPADEVARERAARASRAADQESWSAFTARLQLGQAAAEDRRYLRDLEDLALGRRDKSRVLRELGRSETPETAHAVLLKLGTWDAWVNPYPHRLGLPVVPADLPLPDLPDEERLDLTGLAALAIDDEGNQEPDDALSLDGRRLWVHVADVAALVPPGSPADLEARARGATLYLPEGSVPMLPPPAIPSLGLGLGPAGRPSPALSFGLDLDEDGLVDAVEIRPSWVQVTRLTYGQAESRLEEEPLRGLWALARRNRDRRHERGAVEIELPEVKIDVGDGRVTIRPLPPLRSRDLVAEAMLLAGAAAARFGLEHGFALPFTAQDAPTTDDRPSDLAGMFGLRQHLRPSEHSLHPGPHAGLGLEAYSQVTSPLRRYLDLVVHQQLRAHLCGQPPLTAAEVLERIGAASAAAGAVRQAERQARRHWTLVYLTQHPERTWSGIVVEQRGRRSTVLVPELELDVQVVLRGEPALNSPVELARPEVRLAELAVHFQVLE